MFSRWRRLKRRARTESSSWMLAPRRLDGATVQQQRSWLDTLNLRTRSRTLYRWTTSPPSLLTASLTL